jgi:hypothetical protein
MHGGGAKRVRFKKNQTRVKFKICFKFGLKIKKNSLLLRPAVYSVENLHNNDVREGSTSTGIER